jgi:beta-barrel assembly-enhancing protease
MNKAFIQILTFLFLFFGTWFLLSKINFTGKIDIQKISKTNEEKIGKKIIEYLQNENETVTNDSVVSIINKIKNRICIYNRIDTSKVKIYIFRNSEINAFALPGNNMVVYTGIIDFCKKPEELGGVMAHEMAHIEYNHIVKKLTKEIGIGLLATIAGSNSGEGMIKEIVRIISSSAFDRDMEREADKAAVNYMAKAHIDPENLATLMLRLSVKTDIPGNLEWINTHPNSKERSSEILKLRLTKKFTVKPLLNDTIWASCQHIIDNKYK